MMEPPDCIIGKRTVMRSYSSSSLASSVLRFFHHLRGSAGFEDPSCPVAPEE
jgi:hypothetical protein